MFISRVVSIRCHNGAVSLTLAFVGGLAADTPYGVGYAEPLCCHVSVHIGEADCANCVD